ncbi:MAG TPA: SGNH/GDSL hydrolase family protein, partial [Bryobacteraceae bacterium]|nr:SGNH/GDSL hydrolase family protein [Bryobacteraceae bacterium]
MTRTVIGVVVLFLALASPAGTDTALRVLFIGNSYTFCNNLPAIVERMGSAAGIRIHTRTIAVAGSTLGGHWERGDARLAIREGGWDWVVLQEQSSLGEPLLVNGIPRITGKRRFHAAVRRFAEEIRHAGARMLLFLTWSARTAPEEQQHLSHAYLTIARETGASVAPAGLAWYTVRTENPELNLYMPDGSHPAPAGSYLAASSIYAALTGRSPERLPADANLDAVEARILQRAAWQATRRLSAAGGYLDF